MATNSSQSTDIFIIVNDRPTSLAALAELIHGGEDSRGCYFFAFPNCGQYRIFAGCRNFSVDDARRHWGRGGPSANPECLALVENIAAQIDAKTTAARSAPSAAWTGSPSLHPTLKGNQSDET